MSAEDNRRRMIYADHFGTVETVRVECTRCDATDSAQCVHSLPNDYIARRYFKKWRIRGVGGAKATLCPKHAKHRLTETAQRVR